SLYGSRQMTLKFAKKWNWDYDRDETMQFNGADFGYVQAREILKQAVAHFQGGGLKAAIDSDEARVVRGPHRTEGGDKRMHMSVHCKTMRVIYHIYVSPNGTVSALDQENISGVSPKTGHVDDDPNAPAIANVSQL